jgi:hypothetical protein
MENDINQAINLLRRGQAPANQELLQELSVGIDFIVDFWKDKYLANYISQGGSKVKFVTGRNGSGKTHFLQLFSIEAEKMNYIPVLLSAKEVWLHDFKEIYTAVLKKIDLINCLRLISFEVVKQLGYDPLLIPDGMTFVDYLSSIGQLGPVTKREIRQQLEHMFLSNPLLDNNFAFTCSLLVGGLLGHPVLEDPNKHLLLLWLEGDREAHLSSLRRLGLSPSKINRYNARHMLRSLVEICRMAGYNGVVISIDDMEILVSKDNVENNHYTRMKREDAYESIRELIDEIDTLKNTMFVFSFDRKLIDDDINGLKSYQALWMRIQNEVESTRFNRFTDIVDLDQLIEEVYTPEILIEMSARLSNVINRLSRGAVPITLDIAQELHAKAQYGKVSLPRQVNLSTIQEGADH